VSFLAGKRGFAPTLPGEARLRISRANIHADPVFMRLRFQHGRLDDLKTLHPAYFALVMATGIVSIATHLHGIPVLPAVLFWLNALFLGGLVAATAARILRYRGLSPPTSKAIAAV
jgi:Voltage-dependent anion channel